MIAPHLPPAADTRETGASAGTTDENALPGSPSASPVACISAARPGLPGRAKDPYPVDAAEDAAQPIGVNVFQDSIKKGISGDLRIRTAIRYAIEGDLRFISHQDSLRLFKRALARADLPVRYTQGFNPRPRMTIALPRPVGVASDDELLIIELDADVEPDEIAARISSQMPVGMRLVSVRRLAEKDRQLPCEVEYRLPLDAMSVADMTLTANRLMNASECLVSRPDAKGGAPRTLNIRPFILSAAVREQALVWVQSVSSEGTARVGEVLEALGLPARELLHRVVRSRTVCRE